MNARRLFGVVMSAMAVAAVLAAPQVASANTGAGANEGDGIYRMIEGKRFKLVSRERTTFTLGGGVTSAAQEVVTCWGESQLWQASVPGGTFNTLYASGFSQCSKPVAFLSAQTNVQVFDPITGTWLVEGVPGNYGNGNNTVRVTSNAFSDCPRQSGRYRAHTEHGVSDARYPSLTGGVSHSPASPWLTCGFG